MGEVASIREVRTLGAPAVDWADRADAALAGTGATTAGALRFLSPVVLFSYVICSDRRCFRGCSASVRPYASAVDAVTQRKSVTYLRKSENAGSRFGGLHRSIPDFEMALFSQIRRASLVGHAEFVSDWTVTPPGREQMGASIQQLAAGRRLDRLGTTRTTISMFYGDAERRTAIATCTTSVRALAKVCDQGDEGVAVKQAQPYRLVVTTEGAGRHHAGN